MQTVAADTPINTEALNDSPADDGRTIEGTVTEVKAPDNALVVLDPVRFASELFKPFNDEFTKEKRSAARTKFDITTSTGMAIAKELRTRFVKIRTSAEKAKTKAKKPIDQAGKEILAQYNTIEAAAKAEEKKYQDAITAEEQRQADIEAEKQRIERARIEAIEGRIDDIRLIPSTLAKADAATIEAKLNELVARVLATADFEEHLEVAITAQNTTINELRQLLTTARDREAQAAELARLRAAEEQRKKDDEARQVAAAAAQRQQDEAAALLKRQQNQMAEILEIQSLASGLVAAGKDKDRVLVNAALAKVSLFNPDSYGAMEPMAKMARNAALPVLQDMLAQLPIVEPAAHAEPEATVVPIELDDTGVTIGKAVLSIEPVPAANPSTETLRKAFGVSFPATRTVPQPKRPADLDILELVAGHFEVPSLTALAWLATFDPDAVRAALADEA